MKNATWIAPLLALGMWVTGCTEGAGVTGDGCPPTAPCGNGTVEVDQGESCDPGNLATGAGMNLDMMSCTTLGMSGGELRCNCRCQFDMEGCSNSQGGMGGTMGGQQQ